MAKCSSPDYAGALVISLLEGEISRIEAFRELIKLHEEMIAGIGSIGLKLEKASAGKTKDSVPDLTKQLETKQAEIASFYKGFVYFTLPMNSRLRSQTLRQAFLYLGASQLAEASALRASALNFLKEMQCSPGQLIGDTCKKLELLTLKPFDQSVISFADAGAFMQAPVPPPVLHGLFEAAQSGNYAPLFAPVAAVPCSASAPPLPGAFTDSESGSSEGSVFNNLLGNAGTKPAASADPVWT